MRISPRYDGRVALSLSRLHGKLEKFLNSGKGGIFFNSRRVIFSKGLLVPNLDKAEESERNLGRNSNSKRAEMLRES